MYRRNRWPTRISFILVLAMALLGLYYANTFWAPALGTLDYASYAENVDWVEVAAAVGEQALQLLLGATSGG